MTLASCARLATSGRALALVLLSAGCPGYYYSSPAFFVNGTREPVTVRVQSLQGHIDCSVFTGRGELLADRNLFGEPTTYDVEAGRVLPLSLESEWFGSRQTEQCGLVLQVPGFDSQLVHWDSDVRFAETQGTRAELARESFRRQAIVLEGHGKVTALSVGAGLDLLPLDAGALPAPELADEGGAFGFAGSVPRVPVVRLLRRRVLPDGCFSLELGDDAESASTLFVCAPEWSLPFQEGDELVVEGEESQPPQDQPERTTVARHLVLASSGKGPRLEMWINAPVEQVSQSKRVALVDAEPLRTRCGAYVQRLNLGVADMPAPLAAGEEGEALLAGRRIRALLGRAERIVLAPTACLPAYASLGDRFDLLRLTAAEEP